MNISPTNKVNFTGVIQVKAYRNGRRVLRKGNIRSDIRDLQTILTNNANGNEQIIAMKKTFTSHVPDFKFIHKGTKVDTGKTIRNHVIEERGLGYIFVGKNVEDLDTLGRKIGPEKHHSKEMTGTTDSYEAKELGLNYIERTKKLIDQVKNKVRTHYNSEKDKYTGNELILRIYSKRQNPEDEFLIDHIEFTEIPAKHAEPKVPQMPAAEIITSNIRQTPMKNPATRKKIKKIPQRERLFD